MSLKINKTTGEIFDLPQGYVIESEKNNPLFSQKGSQSVSIAFPATDRNRVLLENANRIDKMYKPSGNGAIRVIVESGHTQQAGVMIINTASDQSINANIGWDESEMYANMGAVQLRDLPNMPVFEAGGSEVDTRVTAMLNHLTHVMKEYIEADYYVFPVVLKKDTVENEDTNGNKTSKDYYEVINDFESTKSDANGMPILSYGEMGELLAWTDRVVPRYMDSEVVLFNVPRGYGVSPFIKVWRLLELIFENYGFALSNNPFKEHRQLRRLVALNNTMDTILTGRLHYRDMMPDMTAKEFLDALYAKFGIQYFVESNTRTVSLHFWKDILASGNVTDDFTKYKTANPSITWTQNKQLKLVANREIEGTNVLYNTFEEFIEKYQYQFRDVTDLEEYDPRYTSIFRAWSRLFCIDDYFTGSKVISSDFFDWDKKSNLAYEEIKMTDLSLPMDSDKRNLLGYLVGLKHAWSDISVSGETVEQNDSKTKLAFAFGWGKTSLQDNVNPGSLMQYQFNYFFASQDNRDCFGRFLSDPFGVPFDISLTIQRDDGLFNRFWKEYDAYIRHSAYGIDVPLKIPESEIIRRKMHQTVLIDNQPMLIESIRFKQNSPDSVSDCKLKTVRLYQPYDLDTEQSIVSYHPQMYYWRAESVKTPNFEEWLINNGYPYTVDGYPGQGDENRFSLLWLPPTEHEYLNQLTRVLEFDYVIGYLFEHTYPTTMNIHQVLTFIPTLIT